MGEQGSAQQGIVVWITGLPSSGKSTLAARLDAALRPLGTPPVVLDGDAVRECIVPAHGYGTQARADFYETLSRLAALLAGQGHVVIVPATALRAAFRDRARARWPHFVEVHMDVPLATCVARDAKGLFRAGIADLPGLGLHYEPPSHPEVVIRGAEPEDVAQVLMAIAAAAGR